jgi:hypothetical protein
MYSNNYDSSISISITNDKIAETHDHQIDDNNIYDVRMRQFCTTYLNQNKASNDDDENDDLLLQRPKCSISPINSIVTTTATTAMNEDDFIYPMAPCIIVQNDNHDTSQNTSSIKLPNISQLMTSSSSSSSSSSYYTSSHDSGIFPYSSTSSPATTLSFSNSNLNYNSSILYQQHQITRPTLNTLQVNQTNNTSVASLSAPTKLFQSTPNKFQINETQSSKASSSSSSLANRKCNFHSILDLAKSSSSSSNNSSLFSTSTSLSSSYLMGKKKKREFNCLYNF